MYEYQATVLAVHDGDTLHLDVDLGQAMRGKPRDFGFDTYVEAGRLRLHEDFRLYGINAPELANPDGSGKAALTYLTGLLQAGTGAFVGPLAIRTYKQPTSTENPEKQEKFGRWLATLWLPGETPGAVLSINDRMVSSGHAVSFMTKGTP